MNLQILGAVFLSSILVACSQQTAPPKIALKSYTVQRLTTHRTLHFIGTIKPLRENLLLTPMDGVIQSMHYQYGQWVEQDKVIFTINSMELQREYNDLLTDYLTTKDTYHSALARFTGTHELWKAGLLSKNNYLSEQSSLTATHIRLMQASLKLSELLEKTGASKQTHLTSLSFDKFDKVRLTLISKHNLINIKSPSTGVLLYPPRSNDDSTGRLTEGSSIKSSQVLGMIGDLNGIRVEIEIPEIDINEVKVGMPATIRGIAFGKHELKGRLVSVNAEASRTSNGGLPSFTALIEVHRLSIKQQAWIKVGMSSEIELSLDNRDTMMIPIAAINPQQGQSLVRVLAANGRLTSQAVITGAVNQNKVEIDSGLQVGDVVVYE